jgi:hypothetical protein
VPAPSVSGGAARPDMAALTMLQQFTSEYWGKEADPVYEQIRNAIDRCQRLYKYDLGITFRTGAKGKFNYEQINRYLNFFDKIGYYEGQHALTPSMVNHSFGAVIIEAYENHELSQYVYLSQRYQPKAFADFQGVARELEKLYRNKPLKEEVYNSCKELYY